MSESSRRYPARPLLGVGALIFDERKRILLVERGREPLKGWWSLPGGLLETGETLTEGVRREVFEETGLVVETRAMVTVFERIMRDPDGRAEYHYVLVDYVCAILGGVLKPADDCSAVRWVNREVLREVTPLTDGTMAVIEKAYGMLS